MAPSMVGQQQGLGREPSLPSSITGARSAADRLLAVVDVLEKRLEPVLRVVPQVQDEKALSEGLPCIRANEVSAVQRIIDEAARRIEGITERVEA